MQLGEQIVAPVGGMPRVPSASLAFMPLLTPFCLCFAAQGLEGELAAAKKHLEQAQAEMRTLNQVSCAVSKECCLRVPMLKSMGQPEWVPTISKHVQPLRLLGVEAAAVCASMSTACILASIIGIA